jgi:hypothetical protein
MKEKKKWIEPEIEEVALESEDEVLATCYTLSLTTRRWGTDCRAKGCQTYP